MVIEESLAGPLLGLFYSTARLRRGHEHFLRQLKTAAESRPAGRRADEERSAGRPPERS